MIAVVTIIDKKIAQEIEDINRIPDQSIPSTRSDDITTPPKEINPANLSTSPSPAESNYWKTQRYNFDMDVKDTFERMDKDM